MIYFYCVIDIFEIYKDYEILNNISHLNKIFFPEADIQDKA